jgi:hypothetical protein
MLSNLVILATVLGASLPSMTTEREAATRVEYYAKLATIAQYDLATARIKLDTYERQWRETHATEWAQRYQLALRDHRDAYGRAILYRAQRDIAREDFAVVAKSIKTRTPYKPAKKVTSAQTGL